MCIKSAARLVRLPATPVYLLPRQHLSANLYDRLSTRPFLTHLEKAWVMTYRLMCAPEVCHGEGVCCHGDIKCENVLVTSWNWVVLTDFAHHKPVRIPVDDPTDFQYFFDSMSRTRCSVAPERFIAPAGRVGGGVSLSLSVSLSLGQLMGEDVLPPAMDVVNMAHVYKHLKKWELT